MQGIVRFVVLPLILGTALSTGAQQKASEQSKKKPPEPFKWINKAKGGLPNRVSQGSYHSRAMDVEIGYCIYLPPGYSSEAAADHVMTAVVAVVNVVAVVAVVTDRTTIRIKPILS